MSARSMHHGGDDRAADDLPLDVLADRLRMLLAEAGYPRAQVDVLEGWEDVYTTTWSVDPDEVQCVPLDVLSKAWEVLGVSR